MNAAIVNFIKLSMYKHGKKISWGLYAIINGLFLVSGLFSVPNYAFAAMSYPSTSCVFTVSGAGTTDLNGTYTYDGNTWSSVNEFSYTGAIATYYLTFSFSSYYEIRDQPGNITLSNGYYYDNTGPNNGSYETINTLNGSGTNPVPTITSSGCGGGGGPATTTPETLFCSHSELASSSCMYVNDPNRDYFNGFLTFIGGFVLILWLFKGRH